ncbi:hypothetical protein HJC23_007472 [Cyclotella cryptica]|uniref:Phosphoglycerate mutase n=1 Tax=Cyclotella cryptica TaxID=29204 RepID=A0ABD3NUN7_9STRA
MINIYVARHGQDVDNANGILNGHRNQPLTDLGRHQAREVAKRMLQEGFRLLSPSRTHPSASSTTPITCLRTIYSSPLRRARETAEIFANILSSECNDESSDSVNVQLVDSLIERNFGIMTGMPISSIIEMCGKEHVLSTEKIHYFLNPEGAETFPDLIERAKSLLTFIETENTKNGDEALGQHSILLVTHGDFGKMIYAAYYDLDWEEVLRQFHFGNSEVLLLAKHSPPEKAHVFETSQFNP